MDEGNGTEYNEELQNNLDQNDVKNMKEGRKMTSRRKLILRRRFPISKKFPVEKGIQSNQLQFMIASILINGIFIIV